MNSPISLNKSEKGSDRILSEEEGKRIIGSVLSHMGTRRPVKILVMTYWTSTNRWSRNKVSVSADTRDVAVIVLPNYVSFAIQSFMTNQIDERSLRGVAEAADHYGELSWRERPHDYGFTPRAYTAAPSTAWSDHTIDRVPEANAELIKTLVEESKAHNFLSAGFIESYGGSLSEYMRDTWGNESSRYIRLTQAQCSATVRTRDGGSSGWAGQSGFDRVSLDEKLLVKKALEKCVAGLNPVRIEPGRYTTILEPMATADLFKWIVLDLHREPPEMGANVETKLGFDNSIGRFRSKLGLKVLDPRLSIFHDPMHPMTATVPYPGVGRVDYVNKGILVGLANSESHAVNELNQDEYNHTRRSFRVDGGDSTIEEMIASTKRGLLVTRLWGLKLVADPLVLTGTTRDGLWLIENGVVSKAVRNFRITESPWFAFNNVEQIGESVPVFNPVSRRLTLASNPYNAIASIVTPAIKVNDFSFTSTVDAI